MTPGQRSALAAVLNEAQAIGCLGPGPVASHIDRALDLALGFTRPIPHAALDLGSGGGIPGLPLALVWPSSRWVLLDGSVTRAAFLERAVEQLGLGDRVSVVAERAEVAGHGRLRASMDLVVARSFGPPGPTAECGSPFLRVDATLVVAEPPGGRPDRWPEAGLALLGLRVGDRLDGPTAYQLLTQASLCPGQYPRRLGIPSKRPLF